MAPTEIMVRVDALLSHVWMVRTFVKHAEETEEDEDLQEIHRELYDYMLALGAPLRANQPDEYLKLAKKKLSKLVRTARTFAEVQPEISTHTNFQMAVRSLNVAVQEIEKLLTSGIPPDPVIEREF